MQEESVWTGECGRAYNPQFGTGIHRPSWRGSAMTTIATPPSVAPRSQGRPYFWFGIFACLLGLALVAGQFLVLKHLDVPWYSPGLATLGALLLLISVAHRRTIPRLLGFVLIAAFAGFQWFFLLSVMKLPAYEGT